MKIYKAIFRFDYPTFYSLHDKLGEFLDYINCITMEPHFKEVKRQFDVVGHAIIVNGNIKSNLFNLHLSLKTFDGAIEFDKGIDFDSLYKTPFWELVDGVLNKLQIKKFDRKGFRVFVIAEKEALKYDSILKYMTSCNTLFCNMANKNFNAPTDIGLIIESINANKESFRIVTGPYKYEEWTKYFELDPSINEGLILDIDSWQDKIVAPGVSIMELTRKNQKLYFDAVSEITNNLIQGMTDVNCSSNSNS